MISDGFRDLHFLFMQGMPSSFFDRIGHTLADHGCRVTGVSLCFGDRLFWRGEECVNYRGRQKDWPGFLRRFLQSEKVTDIVLLGEQRRYHKEAVAIAKACGVRVTVTDYGYLRPDWITLERDGMGGNSRFPKDPLEIQRLAEGVPMPDGEQRYRDSTLKMALGDLAYSFGTVIFWWLYPFYRKSYMRPDPLIYFPAMGLQLVLRSLRRKKAQEQAEAIATAGKRFYLFPLQLEHDFQIVAYSPYDSLDEAIHQVIRSFALHAPADAKLVIKVHPWDPGLRNWRRLIVSESRHLGVQDRVVYLDGGNLDVLIRTASGMVTVNSTSGVRALQLGCPVTILGQASYDIKGLVHRGSLDDFWERPAAPDPELASALVRAMAATIQVRGVFFDDPGLGAAVDQVSYRLLHGKVGEKLQVG